MIVLQLFLYCFLFFLMVRVSVIGGALNGLYFYPAAYQERAFAAGLADRETVRRKRVSFMIPFFAVMLTALLLIIGLWNRITDFRPAYFQSLLFLEVMNWFDGIVIDRLWVGHDSFWRIPGMEGVPYVQSWREVLRKRGILSVIWIFGAAVVAGLVVLIFRKHPINI